MKVKHIDIRNFRGIKSLSWQVKGGLNCIIGPGDSGKTTILTALDYALSPRTSLTFDDTDFYDQDVSEDICIQITLAEWDESRPEIRAFFQESKFAQQKCGLSDSGPLPEPQAGGVVAISVSLRVDKNLEPKWFVVKGRDEGDIQDKVPIYSSERAVLGLSRLDLFSDTHFTWARNTILTRLSSESPGNLNSVLSVVARGMRQMDFSGDQGFADCQTIADAIKKEAQNTGVKLKALSPKIDIQRQSMTAGAISLHENNVPLRNKGNGSKRLIAAAMQMKLHGGKNIALVDEIEVGLEPHRIRGVIHRLKKSGQQVFTTTHSPVVIRELGVAENELYICKRDSAGALTVESLATVPDIQGAVRQNAEAFLGSRIIACEGPTEIGCLRAYDLYRFNADDPPVWSLAVSYFNCEGGGKIKSIGPKLVQLGYETAVFCDNDAQDQLSAEDVANLRSAGAHVCQWDEGNSIERQLFADLPWRHIPEILGVIADSHDTMELSSTVDEIIKNPAVAGQNLGTDPASWPESTLLRQVMGDLAHNGRWIKRVDYALNVFRLAFPHFPDTSAFKIRLAALWDWAQRNE